MAKITFRGPVIAAVVIAWNLPGVSWADPVSNSRTSQSVNSASSPELDLQLSLAGSAFGPITYDRLGVFSGTGVAKRDPNYFSYEPSLKFESLFRGGGLYFRLLWRYFQPTKNSVDGHFKDEEEVAASGQTTVTSSGPGLEFGWNFRRRANPNISFFPYLGLAFEQNTVKVKGERQDFGLAPQDLNYESKLDAVYSRLGVGWRPFSSSVQFEIISGLYLPIWSEVRDGAANSAERDLGKRLHHGMRTGGFIAIGTGFSSGKYDNSRRTLRKTAKRKANAAPRSRLISKDK